MTKRPTKAPVKMTEADIEAHISAALRVVFPALDGGRISHQRSFSVRLGHTVHKVDGTKTDLLRGRLDILIELDGEPLAILEVKGPDEPLGHQVSQQGLSYARILDNERIPPLVITTNGEDCRFFRTWDGSEWHAESRDEKAFQSLFNEAAETSGENIDKAVKQLLNIIPDAWPEAIRRYTKSEIQLITGELEDLTCPVAKNFNIPRKVTVEIANDLHRGLRKLALIGDPFCGKTNVLANLTEHPGTDGLCFLYVNLATSSEGIFERIASVFSEQFFRTSETSAVKTWIVGQLPRISESTSLVVIVDGLDSTSRDHFKADLDTLARHANEGRLSLVISGHEELLNLLSKVKGTKQDSTLGKNLKRFRLDALDGLEWIRAEYDLRNARNATFQSCADFVFELRHPRLLRLLASTIKFSDIATRSENEISVLWSVCRPEWFKRVWDGLADATTRDGFSRMAEALLEQKLVNDGGENYLLMLKIGAINIEKLEKLLDSTTLNWLKDRGFIQLIHRGDGARHYMPKVPELLIVAASQIIAQKTAGLYRDKGSEVALDYLVESSDRLPYCGIACALALAFLGEKNSQMFHDLVLLLLDFTPTSYSLGLGSKFVFAGPSGATHQFEVTESNMEEFEGTQTFGNLTPWLAISYLASRTAMHNKPPIDRSRLIERIGSYSFAITGIEQSPQTFSPGIEMHDLPGGISLLCGESALLEPIVNAICIGYLERDRNIIELCDSAIKDRNLPLIWRLRSAALALFDSSEDGIDLIARQIVEKLDAGLKQCLAEKTTSTTSAPASTQVGSQE